MRKTCDGNKENKSWLLKWHSCCSETWEESGRGLSGLRDEWMRKTGKNEGIGWQRKKAPVWSLFLLTRRRTLLQSMMERLGREMSVDFFCSPLSSHVFLCPMNLHIGLMIGSQTAYVPSAHMRPSPCVVSDLRVKALCSYWGRIRLLLLLCHS